MISSPLIVQSGLAIAAAAAGLLFGRLYFAALRRCVASFMGGNGWVRPLALSVGRIGAAAVFLLIIAHWGAASLLGSLVGFLVARTIALRAQGGSP